jgi:broad specificity phosphatase PhoE
MAVRITNFAHGTTVDNEKELSSGWNDAPLSELGIEQGKKLRELTVHRKFDIVFCSDTKRAHETAKFAFDGLAPIVTDSRLRECNYGDLNGGDSHIVEPMQESNFDRKFPNGESYDDVKDRILDFLNFLKANYDGKTVAVVSHKAPQLALEVLLNHKTWEQALAQDWRKTKNWQPGWNYTLK